MKKLFILLLIGVFAFSCSDDCEQDAKCTLIQGATAYKTSSSSKNATRIYVCHNGSNLEIDITSLQEHLDHGDTEGKCDTLSDGGLTFADGEIVQISCEYDLPFMHIKENGEQWFYDNP